MHTRLFVVRAIVLCWAIVWCGCTTKNLEVVLEDQPTNTADPVENSPEKHHKIHKLISIILTEDPSKLLAELRLWQQDGMGTLLGVASDVTKETILHLVSRWKVTPEKKEVYEQLLWFLLDAGLLPTTPDDEDMTPIHGAAAAGNEMAIRIFVKFLKGLSEPSIDNPLDLSMEDIYGFTPCQLAIQGKHVEVVRFLISDLTLDPGPYITHQAVRYGLTEILADLFFYGRFDLEADLKNRTPFYYAFAKGDDIATINAFISIVKDKILKDKVVLHFPEPNDNIMYAVDPKTGQRLIQYLFLRKGGEEIIKQYLDYAGYKKFVVTDIMPMPSYASPFAIEYVINQVTIQELEKNIDNLVILLLAATEHTYERGLTIIGPLLEKLRQGGVDLVAGNYDGQSILELLVDSFFSFNNRSLLKHLPALVEACSPEECRCMLGAAIRKRKLEQFNCLSKLVASCHPHLTITHRRSDRDGITLYSAAWDDGVMPKSPNSGFVYSFMKKMLDFKAEKTIKPPYRSVEWDDDKLVASFDAKLLADPKLVRDPKLSHLDLSKNRYLLMRLSLQEFGPTGEPILCLAARLGDLPLVNRLLAEGANPEDKDRYGNTPIHSTLLAWDEGCFEDDVLPLDMIQSLLEYGAAKDGESMFSTFSVRSFCYASPKSIEYSINPILYKPNIKLYVPTQELADTIRYRIYDVPFSYHRTTVEVDRWSGTPRFKLDLSAAPMVVRRRIENMLGRIDWSHNRHNRVEFRVFEKWRNT